MLGSTGQRQSAPSERILSDHSWKVRVCSRIPRPAHRAVVDRTTTRVRPQPAQERLQDALHAAATLSALHRQIRGLFLARLELIENQMDPGEEYLVRHYTATTMRCCDWLRCRALGPSVVPKSFSAGSLAGGAPFCVQTIVSNYAVQHYPGVSSHPPR